MNTSWAGRRRCRAVTFDNLQPRLTVVVIENSGPTVALRVAGEIDMASAPVLAARLEDLIRSDKRHLVLDLEGVQLFGADALRVLARAHRALQAVGGSMRLVCTQRLTMRVLTVTGMLALFPVYRDIEVALRDIGGSAGAARRPRRSACLPPRTVAKDSAPPAERVSDPWAHSPRFISDMPAGVP